MTIGLPKLFPLSACRLSPRSWAETFRALLNPRRAVSQDGFDPLFLVAGPLLVLAAVYALALAITRFVA